jgi:hypothetical protein
MVDLAPLASGRPGGKQVMLSADGPAAAWPPGPVIHWPTVQSTISGWRLLPAGRSRRLSSMAWGFALPADAYADASGPIGVAIRTRDGRLAVAGDLPPE